MKVAFFPNEKNWDNNEYYKNLKDSLLKSGVEIAPGEGDLLDRKWLRDNRGEVNILHFHWLHYHYKIKSLYNTKKLLLFIYKLIYARALGYKIVWTVHNLFPHDATKLYIDKFVRKLMCWSAHSIIVMCQCAKNTVTKEFGVPEKIAVIPHGNYTVDTTLRNQRKVIYSKM